MPHKKLFLLAFFCLFFAKTNLYALAITESQSNFSTSSNISESTTSGLYNNFAGTSLTPRTTTNLHIITATGSSTNGYGIRITKDYNNVFNSVTGSIITSGSSGRGISVFDNSSVDNSGSIATSGSSAYGISIRANSSAVNSGSISTNNTSSAYGIYLDGDRSSATNSGTISSKSYGIYGDANFATVNNSGTIVTTVGSSAHGIFLSAGSSSTATSVNYSTVNNSGIITANANGIYSKDAYTQITNSGEIKSGIGNSDSAIRNEGNGATINNSGTITSKNSAIYNSGIGAIINNSGTINGGVVIGDATLNISGGAISGAVDGSNNLGDVNINSNFNQSAAFNKLDQLNIAAAATLFSNAAISANNINLSSGANLTIGAGSTIDGKIQGANSGSGNLNIATDFVASTIGDSSHSIAAINVNSDSSLQISEDIYADNIFVNGELKFSDSNNSTIFGNVAGGGLATINLQSTSQVIDGNFTLNSQDSLAVSLGLKKAGNLTVNQIAAIDSEAKLKITPTAAQGYIANGTKYILVSGASGSSINAISDENILVNGNDSNIFGLLKFTTSLDGDSLILNIDRLSAANATSNKNSQSIYTNLNEIGASSTGLLSEFQGYLDSNGLVGEGLNQALRQIAPQSTKSNLAASFNVVNNFLRPLEARLNKLRNHTEKGFWVQGLGSYATQNEVKDDFGYKIISTGIAFGADKEMSGESTIGVALSYSRSDVKSLDNLQKNLVSSIQSSIYSSHNFDQYFFDSLASVSWNIFSSSRSISALKTNADARFSGQASALKFKTGKIFKLKNGFTITPDISLNFLYNKISGYKENGADELNLKVGGVAAKFLESRAGINFGWMGRVADLHEFQKLSTNLKLSYGHAFVNDAPTTKASFSGQSSVFESKISHLDNDSLKAGIELAAYHKEATTFIGDYEFEKRSTYSAHTLLLKIRQEF